MSTTPLAVTGKISTGKPCAAAALLTATCSIAETSKRPTVPAGAAYNLAAILHASVPPEVKIRPSGVALQKPAMSRRAVSI